ncbi:MAG TPA: hypothetical protein VE961_07840 [Pyrinomonadaceae bacterium]|nr:hypothetical protein [Pyrinomonadaceae bacterium]
MNWKRLLLAIPLGFLIMIVDGLVLVLVNRIYLPEHPPHWLMGILFYFDAWPVTITQHIFPSPRGGPAFLAIVTGAIIDLIVLTIIIYALLSVRAARKAHA